MPNRFIYKYFTKIVIFWTSEKVIWISSVCYQLYRLSQTDIWPLCLFPFGNDAKAINKNSKFESVRCSSKFEKRLWSVTVIAKTWYLDFRIGFVWVGFGCFVEGADLRTIVGVVSGLSLIELLDRLREIELGLHEVYFLDSESVIVLGSGISPNPQITLGACGMSC